MNRKNHGVGIVVGELETLMYQGFLTPFFVSIALFVFLLRK